MSEDIDRIVAESMKNIEKIERQSRAKKELISEEKHIPHASAETAYSGEADHSFRSDCDHL